MCLVCGNKSKGVASTTWYPCLTIYDLGQVRFGFEQSENSTERASLACVAGSHETYTMDLGRN